MIKLSVFTLLTTLVLLGRPLRGQEVYALTAISVTATVTDSYHYTELDAAAAVYYDARTDGFLEQDGTVMQSGQLVGNPDANVELSTPTNPGSVYEAISNHYVRFYYYTEVNSTIIYSDPYGFSFLGSGDYGGTDNIGAPDVSTVAYVEDYYLGSTYVSETAPPPTTSAQATLSLARNTVVQFTATGSPSGGSYSYQSDLVLGSNGPTCCVSSSASDPNVVTLQDPRNASPGGGPTQGGMSSINATYTSPQGSVAHDSFQVAAFGMSCYYRAAESDFRTGNANSPSTSINIPLNGYGSCQPSGVHFRVNPAGPNGTIIHGTYCNTFLCEVHLQGSGTASDGTMMQWNGNNTYKVVTQFKTADGADLVVNQTVARDRCFFDQTAGSKRNPKYCVAPAKSNTVQLDTVGTVAATDIGDISKIYQYRFDLYKGAGAAVCNAYQNPILTGACTSPNSVCPGFTIH